MEETYRKNLYILLWYLSGWGGADYCSTTRRDVIESILVDLSKNGLLDGVTHAEGIEQAISGYKGHPFEQIIRECLESMPTASDPVYRETLTTLWVQK